MATKDFAEHVKARMAADPELAAAVEQEVINTRIARQVCDLREAAGLTQKQLAEMIGTQQSVVSRIEDADYEGHSLGLLKRIADALGKRLRVEFEDPAPRETTVTRAAVNTTVNQVRIEYPPVRNGYVVTGTAAGAR